MGWVVYCVEQNKAVALYDKESIAKAQVTKNNKQRTWELLTGMTNRHNEYAYCSWPAFEAIAMKSKRKGYRNWHEF